MQSIVLQVIPRCLSDIKKTITKFEISPGIQDL
jgi:hypothetical protein